jgi:hypothetical protein
MMEAFLELQRTIYRAHTFLASDTGDLRTLSRDEKELFEFRVQVEPGSSDYKIDLTDIIKSLGSEVINKMDSTHIVVLVLGVALIIGGVVAWKAWLKAKTEQRKTELTDNLQKQMLDNYQAQIGYDTTRYGMLVKAIERLPVLGN